MSVLCMMAGAAAELRERRLGTPFTPSSTHYHRILEIEYAIKNNRPFNLSPKKSRRAHSKRDRDRDRERAKSGRGKYKLAPGYEAGEEREGSSFVEMRRTKRSFSVMMPWRGETRIMAESVLRDWGIGDCLREDRGELTWQPSLALRCSRRRGIGRSLQASQAP